MRHIHPAKVNTPAASWTLVIFEHPANVKNLPTFLTRDSLGQIILAGCRTFALGQHPAKVVYTGAVGLNEHGMFGFSGYYISSQTLHEVHMTQFFYRRYRPSHRLDHELTLARAPS